MRNQKKDFLKQRKGEMLLHIIAPSLRARDIKKYLNKPSYRRNLKEIKGKMRVLTIPSRELKRFQRQLLFEVLYPFSVSKATQAAIPGATVVKNAEIHLKARSFFKIDFKDTFPSITFKTVVNCLEDLFRKYYSGRERYSFSDQDFKILTRTVVRLTTYRNSLPQGVPTSSFLLNLLLFKMDEELMKLAEKNGLIYTRYTDDMVFSSKKQQISIEVRKEIVEIIKKNTQLKLNRKKVSYRTGEAIFPKITGILLFKKEGLKSRLLVPPAAIERYRTIIHKATYDMSIDKDQVIGIVGWVSMVNGGKIPLRLRNNFKKFFITRYPEEFDQFEKKFF